MANFSVGEIFSALEELAPQYDIDPGVAKTLILAENTSKGKVPPRNALFSGDATNQHDTMGLGQVIPSTAEGLKQAGFLPKDWSFDPANLKSQLAASLAAMKEMKGRQRNPADSLELGAMYNGGTKAWEDYKAGRPMNPETTAYLQKMRTSMADLNMTAPPKSGSPGPVIAPGGGGSRKSTSTSTTTTSNVFDPEVMAQYQRSAGLLQNPGGLIDQAMSALTGRGTGVQIAGQGVVESILAAGEDAAASARAQGQLLATAAARRAEILNRANLHPDLASNRAEQAQNAVDATSVAIDNLRPEIDRRMAVGFFDNPLEWLVNQTRLPGMVENYNSLVRVQQDALGRYDASSHLAKSQIDLSTAIDADQTLVAANALAKAEASKAVAKSKEVQLQLSSKSAADALAAVQLGLAATGLAGQQLQMSKETQRIQQGESEADFNKRMVEQQSSDLNLMIKAAGGGGIDMMRFKQLPAATREALMQTVSSGKFGRDFVESLRFVQDFGDINAMAKDQLAVRTWVNGAQQAASKMTLDAQTKAEAGGIKNFNPQKEMVANLSAVSSQYEAQAATDMRTAGEFNPFKVDYNSTSKLPELKDNIIAQTIQKHGPKGTEPLWDSIDEQHLLKRAVLDIRMSANPEVAVKKYANDVAQYYKVATDKQVYNTKWNLFGLSKPDKTYAVKLPQLTLGTRTIDLGNPVEVENMLTRKVAEDTVRANIITSTMLSARE